MSGFRVSKKKKGRLRFLELFCPIRKKKWNHFNDANMGPTLFLQKAPWFLKNRNRHFRMTKTCPPSQWPFRFRVTPRFRFRRFVERLGVICSTIAIPTNRATFPWKSSRTFFGWSECHIWRSCVFFVHAKFLGKCLFPIFCTPSKRKIDIPTLDCKHLLQDDFLPKKKSPQRQKKRKKPEKLLFLPIKHSFKARPPTSFFLGNH